MTDQISNPPGLLPHMMIMAPHASALGMTLASVETAEVVLHVPFRSDIVGDPERGVIAGGVVTALLDHACGQAVMAALKDYQTIATLDLRIDYMRSAEPGLGVFCHAHCYKVTRSVAFVRGQAYDRDRGDPVATAQAAFMLNTSARRSSKATAI